MPSPQRVNWAKLRVGVMAVVALTIIGVLIFLMTGNKRIFVKKELVYTYMDDAAAVIPGAPVMLNGIEIGEISKIDLTGETTPNRIVRLEMKIQADKFSQIPVDSQAALSAANLLGAKFINIKKGRASETVKPGGEIKSLNTLEFEEMQQQIGTTLTSLQSIIKRVDAIVGVVEKGQGSIGKLLVDEELYNRMMAIVSDVKVVTQALTQAKGTAGKLIYDDALYLDIRRSMARLDTIVQDLQQGRGTAGKLLKDDQVYDEARKTISGFRQMADDLNAGKGSAGKILKSDELHNEIAAIIKKMDSIIDRINSGQGTIGQLLVNQQLYDNMNGATRELTGLLKDFRADPRKYLRIKLAIF